MVRTSSPFLFVLIISLQTLTGCRAQVSGCTDPRASNFNAEASLNDGSCLFDQASVLPEWSLPLSSELVETSGLIMWDGRLVTHNDSEDTRLYLVDTGTGEVSEMFNLQGVQNKDWEDLAQDEDYIYVGDFGNNADGGRTDLHVLKVSKAGLLHGRQEIGEIKFTYAGNESPVPVAPNSTDFDCEAMIAMGDSLYLFTKQWVSGNTTVYALSKQPGEYLLRPRETLAVEGLVTGAVYLGGEGAVVLCGYNVLLQPFFYLLYDFPGTGFSAGNRRRIDVPLTLYQVEGIADAGGKRFYVTNEQLVTPPYANTPQQLHLFSLKDFL